MLFSDIVNQHYDNLNDGDLQMVKWINANLNEVPAMGTNEFAKICHSSKSSVIRFTQKLGFTGFSELRNFLKWQSNPNDAAKEGLFKNRIFADAKRTITYLEDNKWETIYRSLERSRNVYLLGTGVTQQNQAAELQRLLLLIGKPAQMIPASSQSNEFKRIMENINEEDLIFVLSLSGENQHLLNVLNVLSTHRATIVSITNMQNNVLSGRSDHSLYASSSRSPNPNDWWLQTASSFFLVIEAFAFGYMDYCRRDSD
ncbi:MurR/RpiR family transcriptional regulator [Enterococcus gilvus]|uniref:MurR/RpiR family transcriptional regulator n=1 Tax=Enterococcus gilvus TaxID=160453 RepID=UPI0028D7F068|nr:MurR/RpiR family transcriptional regulator [Enterococcus gilvus]